MPRPRKPPRLWIRTEAVGGKQRKSWIIKDGTSNIRTGCLEHQTDEAARALAEYTAGKFRPQLGGRSSEVTIGDVLTVYADDVAPNTSRPREIEQIILRLNAFFGAMTVSEIKGKTCRDYATHRQTQSGARRDLEIMRAAVRYYHKEHGLDVLPAFTLPKKSLPKDRYLTRSEAAALLMATLGWEKIGSGDNAYWRRRKMHKGKHLARLILIGLYTGTRPGAVKSLQWIRNTQGGWADMDRGVIFRRADGEHVAHNKRKTPVKIAKRLMAHMRRWKRLDGWTDQKTGLRYIVHYQGRPFVKENKAFRNTIAAAGLDSLVTPHVLRHTRGTWLAQAGVKSTEAAASLGLTVEEYERTYLHNDPDFQAEAADAF